MAGEPQRIVGWIAPWVGAAPMPLYIGYGLDSPKEFWAG